MSTDLQSALANLQTNNYSSVAIITAIAYDYVLTLPKEIEYIWKKSWTWITAIFAIVRYIGVFCAITDALFGSTFMPGPVKICECILNPPQGPFRLCCPGEGTIIFSTGNSPFTVFLSAADLVMLLRVYALYGCSRIILVILLVVYIPAVVLLVIATAMFTNPKSMSMSTFQIDNVSICALESTTSSNVGTYAFIPRFVLGALMCIFAIFQFLRQSLQMYRVARRWQPNQYLGLLVREGVLYFIVNLLYNIISLMYGSAPEAAFLAMTTFCYIFLYIIIPRFIINVRELSTRDVQCDRGIDTGFGVWSRSGPSAAAGENIVFADAARVDEGTVGIEEIQMVEEESMANGFAGRA